MYLILVSALMIIVGHVLGIVAVIAAACVYGYYHHMAVSKFGGITGDLAGYFLQVCELAVAAVVVICDCIRIAI